MNTQYVKAQEYCSIKDEFSELRFTIMDGIRRIDQGTNDIALLTQAIEDLIDAKICSHLDEMANRIEDSIGVSP